MNPKSDLKSTTDPISNWDRLALSGWKSSPDQTWCHRHILHPAIHSAVKEADPVQILDFGCGTGHLAKGLIELGYSCAAYDPAKSVAHGASNEIGVIAHDDIHQFNGMKFDCVVSNLVLSAVENLDLVLSQIRGLLRANGDCFFTVPHPAFTLLDEVHLTTRRQWMDSSHHRTGVWRYLQRDRQSVEWEASLPSTIMYHRTLGDYSKALTACGFYVNGLVEPLPIGAGSNENPTLYSLHSSLPSFIMFLAKATD